MNNNQFPDMVSGRQLERRLLFKPIPQVGACSSLHEDRNHFVVAVLGGVMKRGSAVQVQDVNVRTCLQEFGDHFNSFGLGLEHTIVERCPSLVVLYVDKVFIVNQ